MYKKGKTSGAIQADVWNLTTTVNSFIHLFAFLGSLQDYKIHMDVESVNTVHKSNKNICIISIVKKWNQKKKGTTILLIRRSMMLEDLT